MSRPGFFGRPLYFSILALLFCASLAASTAIPGDLLAAFLIPGCMMYGVGMFRDVKSTVLFGDARIVSAMEASPLFAFLCKYGYSAAIPVHVSTEMLVIIIVIPFAVLHAIPYDPAGTWFGVSAGALWFLGALHWHAGARNEALYAEMGGVRARA